jgi:hypothetical protein
MIHLFEAGELEQVEGNRWRTSVVRPDLPARSLVPSWNLALEPEQSLEIWGRMRRKGAWCEWSRIAIRGPLAKECCPILAPETELAADEWLSPGDTIEEAQIELRGGSGQPPRRLGLSFWPVFAPIALPEDPVEPLVTSGRVRQYQLASEEAGRLCGPSCLSMALRHFGLGRDPLEVAAAVRDPWAGIYGNWSLLAAYAGELGLASWVERGGGPVRLAHHLERGRLAILSFQWREHELTGAPLACSDGHLVLAVGCQSEGCWVMDPAFREEDRELHLYDWQSVLRAWKSGASVVLGREF